jgi:hypothetical protein
MKMKARNERPEKRGPARYRSSTIKEKKQD